jgi:hypothetical protein
MDPVWYCKAAKFAILDLLIPLEVQSILLVDQAAIFRGDVSAFQRLQLDGAVCAAPIISTSQKKSFYWNIHGYIVVRFKRPFHTTSLVYVDMVKWRESRAGDIYRGLYKSAVELHLFVSQVDDDLFNQMQLDVQVVTLPEGTAFCSGYHDRDVAASAFSMMICETDSVEFLGKEYDEIKEAAAQKY